MARKPKAKPDADAGANADANVASASPDPQAGLGPPTPATTPGGGSGNRPPLPKNTPQNPTSDQGARLKAKLTEYFSELEETYRLRPVEFVEDIILRNHPEIKLDEWQKDLLRRIARGERRISVRAGHGVGKTACLAWASIWFMFTRFPQRTVLTAPTATQLFDALFNEIRRWINELPEILRDRLEVYSSHIELKAAPEQSYIAARTSAADKPEALQGVHSANVLLICDEASAIPEAVFEAATGSMSGHNACTVLLGNPTRNSGLFFNSHHSLRGMWSTMHVSCIDSPRVDRDFIEQVRETYGEGSNQYRVRVLGEFAQHEDDVLISAELVDLAMARDIALDVTQPLIYGVDIARFGDDRSVLCKRRGAVVVEIKKWRAADLMETTGRIANEAAGDRPSEINVDSIGLGAGVADRLRELGFNVRDVNVAEASALNPQAYRLRDELWLTTRDWLAQRACKLPKDDDLRLELVSPTYGFASNGKLKVEGKPDMKRRLKRSPDLADALCLTFAGQGAMVGGRASTWTAGKPLRRNISGTV